MRTVFAPRMYVDGEPGKSVLIIDERRGHSHVRVERTDLESLIKALEERVLTPGCSHCRTMKVGGSISVSCRSCGRHL